MTKQKIVVFVLMTILVVSPISVSAASVNAGSKPGDFFYFLDRGFEGVGMFFTFNKEKRAQKAIEHAEERLAEAEAIAGTDDSDEVEGVLKDYDESVAQANKEAEEVKEEEKKAKLLSTIDENYARHKEVLEKVLEQVPEQAKESIKKVINKSLEKYEEAIKKIDELKKENSKLKAEIEKLKKGNGEMEDDDKNKNANIVTGWKTYRNDDYGFEFKYPKENAVKENTVEDLGGTSVGLYLSILFPKAKIYFLITENKDALTIEDHFKKMYENCGSGYNAPCPPPSIKFFQLGEIKGLKDYNSNSYHFQKEDEKDFIYIFAAPLALGGGNISEILEKIISTFRFIDKEEMGISMTAKGDCDDLASKLESCESYSCKFIHPFTGEMMEREITGETQGKCHYIEQMPNGGKMECNYSIELRTAVAQYYRAIDSAETFGTKVSSNLTKTNVTQTINGEEVEDSLQKALNNGQCVISGY